MTTEVKQNLLQLSPLTMYRTASNKIIIVSEMSNLINEKNVINVQG